MTAPTPSFTEETLRALCDELATRDSDMASIIAQYGYPPFWSRPNTYESLIHFILEQQVSLASALAALEKLRAHVGEITPANVSTLTDEAFRSVYFSRQKTGYARGITAAILDGALDLPALQGLSDADVRTQLIKHKGIGNWTVDVYLIMVLHRTDVFPTGDIAAMNALRTLKGLPKNTPTAELERLAETWRPYRTIATMLLWHFYLQNRTQKQ